MLSYSWILSVGNSDRGQGNGLSLLYNVYDLILGRHKVWGWLSSWGLESSAGWFTGMSVTSMMERLHVASSCDLASAQHDNLSIGRLFTGSGLHMHVFQQARWKPYSLLRPSLAILIASLLPYCVGENSHRPSRIQRGRGREQTLPLGAEVAKSHCRRACEVLKTQSVTEVVNNCPV